MTKRHRDLVVALMLILVASCDRGGKLPAEGHSMHVLSLPFVALADGERIESLEIVATCARFRALHRIPNDWSMELTGPTSEVSTLTATAGHGTAALTTTDAFRDFATILVVDPTCLDLRATMSLFTTEEERTVAFARSEFALRPAAAP